MGTSLPFGNIAVKARSNPSSRQESGPSGIGRFKDLSGSGSCSDKTGCSVRA